MPEAGDDAIQHRDCLLMRKHCVTLSVICSLCDHGAATNIMPLLCRRRHCVQPPVVCSLCDWGACHQRHAPCSAGDSKLTIGITAARMKYTGVMERPFFTVSLRTQRGQLIEPAHNTLPALWDAKNNVLKAGDVLALSTPVRSLPDGELQGPGRAPVCLDDLPEQLLLSAQPHLAASLRKLPGQAACLAAARLQQPGPQEKCCAKRGQPAVRLNYGMPVVAYSQQPALLTRAHWPLVPPVGSLLALDALRLLLNSHTPRHLPTWP